MNAVEGQAVARYQRSQRRLSLQQREAVTGYLLLSPWILGGVLFIVGPMVASMVFSLSEYDVISPMRFIGLKNYKVAFLEDKLFWSSLARTLYYVAVVVPVGTLGSLLAALLLNEKVVVQNLFRTFFFLPHLTPVVAAAILWKWIFHPDWGPVNYFLGLLGVKGPAWMLSEQWVIPSLILIALWGSIGGNRMMIFLAGLQGVPQELYEAAEIDGANGWHKFRHVTLPMISSTLFFNLVLGVIGALGVFASAYVANNGGPGHASWFFALHIYNQAFVYFNMGYASALAWVFFAIMFVFTYIQFRQSSKWVYYAGER